MHIKPGFMLLEVLLALFILVSAIYVLSDIQIKSMFRVSGICSEMNRIFLIKKELYVTLYDKQKQTKPTSVTINNPPTKILTRQVPIDPKSSLNKVAEEITLIETTGSWTSNQRKYNISMITLVPKIKEKKQQTQ